MAIREFNFDKARRITPEEVEMYRKAIEKKLGLKRPSRLKMLKAQSKYKLVSLRLDPRILRWAKHEAQERGVEYDMIINEILLREAA